jgi:predicted acetyltransferase
MADLTIRPITADEYTASLRATHAAFGGHLREEEIERLRIEFEEGRSLAALDGESIVGTTSGLSFEMTVPGGVLPVLAVTSVGVVPTHRRRGVLTGLMRRQLDDAHAAGLPAAALWASEAVIYGRFGYGMATLSGGISVERAHVRLLRPRPEAPAVRLLERDEALKAVPAVYDRARQGIPGMMGRDAAYTDYRFWIPEHHREGFSEYFFVVHESTDGPEGYVVYRTKGDWSEGTPAGTVEVEELVAATPEAYEGLWRFLLGLDLFARIETYVARPDEPLLHMVTEPRRLRLRLSDGLWVRLVDVPAALAGRRYQVDGSVVLDVRDDFCQWNDGRYHLEGGPDGAECRPTDQNPDLVLSAADLGAVYLGGTRLVTLAEAGRVQELSEGALRRADAMFGWPVTPWCPYHF